MASFVTVTSSNRGAARRRGRAVRRAAGMARRRGPWPTHGTHGLLRRGTDGRVRRPALPAPSARPSACPSPRPFRPPLPLALPLGGSPSLPPAPQGRLQPPPKPRSCSCPDWRFHGGGCGTRRMEGRMSKPFEGKVERVPYSCYHLLPDFGRRQRMSVAFACTQVLTHALCRSFFLAICATLLLQTLREAPTLRQV